VIDNNRHAQADILADLGATGQLAACAQQPGQPIKPRQKLGRHAK
jgi:hypothetical protein